MQTWKATVRNHMEGIAAVACPLAARAQQAAMPLVGFLNALGENDRPNLPAAFRRGLSETGYVDGRNMAIAYRFAEKSPTICSRSPTR